MRKTLSILGLAVLGLLLVASPSFSAVNMWTATGNGIGTEATNGSYYVLPNTSVATSSYVNCTRWTCATLMIGGDMDSCKYTVQGSLDASNWYDVVAETLINGTDETYALQVLHPLLWTGAAVTPAAATTTTNSWRDYPLPNFLRVKFQNHDKAGADTAENVTIRIRYEY